MFPQAYLDWPQRKSGNRGLCQNRKWLTSCPCLIWLLSTPISLPRTHSLDPCLTAWSLKNVVFPHAQRNKMILANLWQISATGIFSKRSGSFAFPLHHLGIHISHFQTWPFCVHILSVLTSLICLVDWVDYFH